MKQGLRLAFPAVETLGAFVSNCSVNRTAAKKQSLLKNRWMNLLAVVSIVVAATVASPVRGLAAQGGVIVSDQNDCSVGPTNDNQLAPSQTAYVWLIFNSPTSVRGYTYEITGTNNPFDSGILKIRFNQCGKTNATYFVAKFTTPSEPGGYTLTVFDETGAKVSSDNFTVE
jgi:hypothetical protein